MTDLAAKEAAARASEAQSRLALASTYVPGPAPWIAAGEASGSWIHDITGTKYLDFGEGSRISLLGHSYSTPAHFLQEHLSHYLYPGRPSDVAAGYVTRYAELLSRRFPEAEDGPQQVMVCSGIAEARQVIQQITADVGVVEIRYTSAAGPIDPVIMQSALQGARQAGKLVLVDEIDSGFGRTGSFVSCSRYDFLPDIVLLGPSGGGGLPFAALVAPRSVFAGVSEVTPYFTSPPVCASALGVLANMTPALFSHVTQMGELLEGRIEEVSRQFGRPIRLTGVGLLRQVVLADSARREQFRAGCRERGVIIGTDLVVTPPLTVQPDEIEMAVDTMADVLMEWGS